MAKLKPTKEALSGGNTPEPNGGKIVDDLEAMDAKWKSVKE